MCGVYVFLCPTDVNDAWIFSTESFRCGTTAAFVILHFYSSIHWSVYFLLLLRNIATSHLVVGHLMQSNETHKLNWIFKMVLDFIIEFMEMCTGASFNQHRAHLTVSKIVCVYSTICAQCQLKHPIVVLFGYWNDACAWVLNECLSRAYVYVWACHVVWKLVYTTFGLYESSTWRLVCECVSQHIYFIIPVWLVCATKRDSICHISFIFI